VYGKKGLRDGLCSNTKEERRSTIEVKRGRGSYSDSLVEEWDVDGWMDGDRGLWGSGITNIPPR